MFKVGDLVAVIDDVIKGKVVGVSEVEITIETSDGFPFKFSPRELVVIKDNQHDISKFSDIENESLLKSKLTTEKKKKKIQFKSDKLKNIPPMEVDLHIHHLVASTKGMDNFDMLTLQMDTAKSKLEFAIKNRIPKVVFIHGVGEGVLKKELYFLLKRYPVEFYEASFQKYGLGATEVYIYQNPKN